MKTDMVKVIYSTISMTQVPTTTPGSPNYIAIAININIDINIYIHFDWSSQMNFRNFNLQTYNHGAIDTETGTTERKERK